MVLKAKTTGCVSIPFKKFTLNEESQGSLGDFGKNIQGEFIEWCNLQWGLSLTRNVQETPFHYETIDDH